MDLKGFGSPELNLKSMQVQNGGKVGEGPGKGSGELPIYWL